MTTRWNRRTNRGRVVYDRPPKAFRFRDIERIVRTTCVDVSDDSEFLELWSAFAALTSCFWENRSMLPGQVNSANAWAVTLQLYDIIKKFYDFGLIKYELVLAAEATERDVFEGEGDFGGGGASRDIEEEPENGTSEISD